jgi:nucleoside-diphosphate-sugar epimerase
VADSLRAEGHEVAVVDDLSRGRHQNVPEGAAFYDLDVRSGGEEAPPSAAYVSQKLIAECLFHARDTPRPKARPKLAR